LQGCLIQQLVRVCAEFDVAEPNVRASLGSHYFSHTTQIFCFWRIMCIGNGLSSLPITPITLRGFRPITPITLHGFRPIMPIMLRGFRPITPITLRGFRV
jgi:hypothetical protein